MIKTIVLCSMMSIIGWFFACLAVMQYKYHTIKRFLKPRIFLKKNKMLALAFYVLMGVAAGVMFSEYGYLPSKCIRYMILICGICVIAYIDKTSQIIPNFILIALLVVRTVLLVIDLILYTDAWQTILLSTFGGMILGFIIFMIAYLLSRKGIGLGDVKLVAVIGYYLGASALYGVIILSLLSCVIYTGVQMIRKKLKLKDEVAFGPFLAIGTVLGILMGI